MRRYAYMSLLVLTLGACICAPAAAEKKPKLPVTAVIQAKPEKIKAVVLAEFVPFGYSIDSDVAAQLRISRALSTDETTSYMLDHLIVGTPGQCRRVHTFIFLPEENGATNVTMQWETVCQQRRGDEFRSANDKKKEIKWMQETLATIKEKAESKAE